MYIPPAIEYCIRSIYGIIPEKRIKTKTRRRTSNKLTIEDMKIILEEFNIRTGDSLMIHSSFSFIDASPDDMITLLLNKIGEDGTLLFPTHPALEFRNGKYYYDISTSKSRAGYLTEYFKNMPGVIRSHHPFSSLAAVGKLADYFMENNLNHDKPLPHGKDSAYYKFCQSNGKVLCLGVTAIGRASVKHVAEEILDEEFILKNIFEEIHVIVTDKNEYIGDFIVRKRTDKLIRFLAKSRLERDWIKNGIVFKKKIKGIPVEYLDANKCMNWMLQKEKNNYIMYPFAKFVKEFKR